MDFPVKLLEEPSWVYEKSELEQVIVALLKNPIGSFIQSCTTGAQFSIHTSDASILDEGVRSTLAQIPNITVNSVSINGTDIIISITYRGEIIKYQYSYQYENS